MFSLTFDDGPDPRGTPAVLDALAREDARATFFVLGQCVEKHPDLYARVIAEGHEIGVHGHDHLRHPIAGRDAVAEDLDAALEVLGETPALWRVPWGDLAPWTGQVAAARGLTLAGWTVDTNDWRGDPAKTMLRAVKRRLRSGVGGAGARRRRAGRAATGLRRDGAADRAARRRCARSEGSSRSRSTTAWPVPVPAGNNPEVLAA